MKVVCNDCLHFVSPLHGCHQFCVNLHQKGFKKDSTTIMAKITLFRVHRSGIIELRLNHQSTHTSRSLPFKIDENQWRDGRVVNHPQKDAINIALAATLASAQAELLRIVNTIPTSNKTAVELMNMVCASIFHEGEEVPSVGLFDAFDAFIRTHERKSTRVLYTTSLKKLREFDSGASFETIDAEWLNRFNTWMTHHHLSVNYRSIQLRNLRAVFNYAIDKHYTTNYPFRGWSIKSESVDSRDLTPEQWRALLEYQKTADEKTQRYIDLFLLQFLLIGINIVDLYNLTPADCLRGRIRYTRLKTGKKYNIKIHPMAAEILAKYKGGHHLIDWFDNITNYNWLNKEENRILKEIGKELRFDQRMSSYVSRYSWASIAFNELDIPMQVISQALGHSFGLKVTAGYINVNPKQVDEANDKVIAYTFGAGGSI